MKKLTSVVLSVLIFISLLGCLFTQTTVSATETVSTSTNLITNGDFESFDVNTAHSNTGLPGLGSRSVKYTFIIDKTNGQWYRSKGGHAPLDAPDLDEDYEIVADPDTTYPTYFGDNNQRVLEPGSNSNHVVRAVQDLYTQVEPKDNGEYALSFKFKLPNNSTGLNFLGLALATPKPLFKNSPQASATILKPYDIVDATLDSSGTDSGITIDNDNNIKFSGTSTEWQNVKVTFKAKRDNTVDIPVYTENGVDYTFPVLLRIWFNGSPKDLTEYIMDDSIIITTSYIKECIYFDDFEMYEVPETVGIKWEDAKGTELQAEDTANIFANTSVEEDGSEGTKTVRIDYDRESGAYAFKGWSYNGTIISTDETYAIDTLSYPDLKLLKAVMISANRLAASSYEGYTVGTSLKHTDASSYPSGYSFGGNNGTGYFGQTKQETIYDNKGTPIEQESTGSYSANSVSATISANKVHSGKNSVLLENNFWTASLGIDVKPNTDYVLSYYVLAPKYLDNQTVNTIERSAISTTLNTGDNSNAVAPANVSLNSATELYLDDIILRDKHDGENWIKVTHKFNSMNLNKVYLVITQTAIDGIAGSSAYIDDITCYAENLTFDDLGIADSIEYKGASIRAYVTENKPQALRHKFAIQKALIDNGNDLYGDVVEYGSVAIRTDYLGNKELVMNGAYKYEGNERKAVTGVAYKTDTGTDIIFAQDDNTKIFTAALTGIGKTSSGTNYDAFGKSYTVRNYVIFRDRNTGKETIVYTETQSYSVFDVMKAIEDKYYKQNSSGSVDEKVEADYNTIQSIFSKIPDQKTAYNNWKNSQNS